MMSTIPCSPLNRPRSNSVITDSTELVQKKMMKYEQVTMGLECPSLPEFKVRDHVKQVMKELSSNASIEFTELTLAEIRTFVKSKVLPHGQCKQLTNCLLSKTEAPDKVIGEVLAMTWRRYPSEVEQTISDKGQLHHLGILRVCIIHISNTYKYADHVRLAELISTTLIICQVPPLDLFDNHGKQLQHENKTKMLRMVAHLRRDCNTVNSCTGCRHGKQQGKTFIPLPFSSRDKSAQKLIEVSSLVDLKTCSCKEKPRKRNYQTESPKHKKQNIATELKRDSAIPRDLSQTIFHDYDMYSPRESSTQLETAEKNVKDIDFSIEWTYV